MREERELEEIEMLLKPIDDLLPNYVMYGLKHLAP